MSTFVYAAKLVDLRENTTMTVEVDDRLVVLARVEGQVYCIDDLCTHDGGPLGDGFLDGYAIACPRHGARFDVRTGKVLCMPATEDTKAHEVKLQGEDILVRLSPS